MIAVNNYDIWNSNCWMVENERTHNSQLLPNEDRKYIKNMLNSIHINGQMEQHDYK